jgi:hypothetical protein
VALCLTLAVAAPARAADDEDVAPDTKFLRGILEGIGLQRDEKIINYQERPPLVIPPSRTLPPPERSDALIANNPNWPKDPDVLRAKEEAARERSRAFISADEAIRNEQRPLSPSELTPGPKPRASRTAKSQAPGSSFDERDNQRLTPSQLGYTGGLFSNMFGGRSDEVGRFTGEPPRTSLTEPPPGYQTPSPDQPYGMTDREKAPKATNYLLDRDKGNTEK